MLSSVSLLMWTSMECVYCVGLLKCALDFCDKEFSFVSKLFIDIICEVVVAPPTKIMIDWG